MKRADWSLNEIEALARKAARGAGYPWGLADDAGNAVRWLCAFGLPGAEALRILLECDGISPEACPIRRGAMLCDGLIAQDANLPGITAPLLLLPAAAMTARDGRVAIRLAWGGGQVVVTADGVFTRDLPVSAALADVALSRVEQAEGDALHAGFRASVDVGTLAALNTFAARTYAPATEQSRAGAGAGLSDND